MTLSRVPRELATRLERELYARCGFATSENLAESLFEPVIREAMQKAQPQWISVEEKLPEDRKAVLVAHENLGNWVWFATRVSGQWKQSHNHDMEFNTGEVTHWMPLPEPPNTVASSLTEQETTK